MCTVVQLLLYIRYTYVENSIHHSYLLDSTFTFNVFSAVHHRPYQCHRLETICCQVHKIMQLKGTVARDFLLRFLSTKQLLWGLLNISYNHLEF